VFRDRQKAFVNALEATKNELQDVSEDVNLAIIWRKDVNNLKYEWLSRPWTSKSENETEKELRTVLQRLLSANEVLTHEAIVHQLFDEHAISLFVKMTNKLIEAVEAIHENITQDEILPSLSLVATVIFILIGG
jgi:hypothetical protein